MDNRSYSTGMEKFWGVEVSYKERRFLLIFHKFARACDDKIAYLDYGLYCSMKEQISICVHIRVY